MKSPVIFCPKARGVYAYMALLDHLLKLDKKTCSEAINE
jgi:chromosome partitioning protein